jgi:hypothetical protein
VFHVCLSRVRQATLAVSGFALTEHNHFVAE